MPELPEVETIVRSIAPRLEGRRIVAARFSSRRVLRGDPKKTAARLAGRTIERVRRHGKFIVVDLSGGLCLAIHLGMTGKLLWNGAESPYAHAVFELDRGRLIYDDVRQFGRIELCDRLPQRIERLGPDALAVTEPDLARMLRARRGRIKPLLLNQAFLRGLGNIYVDESLFRAGIHPLAAAARLSRPRVRRLHAAIRHVLETAIERGGSSISDYVDADGRAGSFQNAHQVYGKEGAPCPRCKTPIRRIVVGQRGTHFCPKCQRP
ncbi:MAG: bifunctional DNA-formamidopyrimidine glycosylase/DNA-(apurinic or apyrimidinic site) lyase [Acidobacteriota bacterium]